MAENREASNGQALLVGFVATAISIGVVNAVFLPCVGMFSSLRSPWTASVFEPIFMHALPQLVLLALAGSCVVSTRRWLLPSAICLLLLPAFESASSGSGPADWARAIEPLKAMRTTFFDIAVLLNAGLIYVWLRRERGTGPPSGGRVASSR